MYSSAKGYTTIEQIHFHMAKMPNSVCMEIVFQALSHARKSFTRNNAN